MTTRRCSLHLKVLGFAAVAIQLAGCAATPVTSVFVAADDQECLARVMYFESIRSSEDGMLAVGTVVMNRLESGRYPNSVCGVVGQKSQFAPGALTRPLDEGRSAALARRVAGSVLQGQRHPRLAKKVMFFHTAGYHYPYSNMRYVLAAGGNVFYYKDNRPESIASAAPTDPKLRAYASKLAPEATMAFAEQAPAEQAPVVQASAAQAVAAEAQIGPPPEAPPQVADAQPAPVEPGTPPAEAAER